MPRTNQDLEVQLEDDGMSNSRRGRSGMGSRLAVLLIGRWYWIVLGMILGTAGAAYYLSKAVPEYAASATLMVKQRTSGVLGTDQPGEIDMRSVEAMNTVAERLKRMELLEKVAARGEVRKMQGLVPRRVRWLPGWLEIWMGVDGGEGRDVAAVPSDKALAAMLAGRMKVSVRRGTRLLDIVVTHPSPKAAAVLADAVADEYIKESSQSKVTGRSNSLELLSAKSDEARGSLQIAQRALASYVRALASHEQLEEKEKEMTELRRRYLPKHPKMIGCSAQVEILQKRFLEHFDFAANSGADQSYWKETNLLKSTADGALQDRLNQARQALLARTAVLKSEIQSQEMVFNAILTKMGETDVNQGSEDSEIELSNPAAVPWLPVSPVPSKAWFLGLAAGGMLGLGMAYLSIRIDDKFRTVFEVEGETGLRALGAVPQLSFERLSELLKRSKEEVRGRESGWTTEVLFRTCFVSTHIAEMFRVLRTSVTLLGRESERKITMFTSAIPGEGKTLIAGNFALAAAAQGRKVLLVDLDLRKPSAHLLFGLNPQGPASGVAGVLRNRSRIEDSVVRDVAPNLDLLMCYDRYPDPGELLVGESLEHLFQSAGSCYDVVVVDSAPLLPVPDSRLIARHVNNLCLVVRAGYVPRNTVRRALNLLTSGGCSVAGVVVNGFVDKASLSSLNYGYSKRGTYGTYGSYGSAHG